MQFRKRTKEFIDKYGKKVTSKYIIMADKAENLPIADKVSDTTTPVTCDKVTKVEEIASIHKELAKTEGGAVLLTEDLFRNLCAGNSYQIGNYLVTITEKRSGYGTGHKTVLSGTVNGEPFELLSIEEIKPLVGVDYKRPKEGRKTPAGRCYYKLNADEFRADIESLANEEVSKAWNTLRGLCGEIEAEERRKAAEAAKAKREEEKKDKRRRRANAFTSDASTAALLAELRRRGINIPQD